MKNSYNFNQPVIILLTAIVILIAASSIPEFELIDGVDIKNVDMLSDLKVEEEFEEFQFDEYYEDEDTNDYEENEEDTIDFESNSSAKYNINKAGLSVKIVEDFVKNEMSKINSVPAQPISIKKQKITGNISQLKSFVRALKSAKSKQVRIAHFGDSGIEGDLVSADLREILQSKYGGSGLGFLPVITADINYRVSTRFSNSSGWKDFGINKRNPDRLPVGINGEVFINGANGWFEYKPNSRYRHSKTFDQIKIFYSDANSTSFSYTINGSKKNRGKLSKGSGVKEFSAKTPNAKSVKVELSSKEQAYFYGISLESDKGVIVDNFPFRGNTGVDLKDIPVSTLKDFDKYLDYDLIVFQFGLNALSARNFKKYEKDMIKVVKHYQKAFPKAGFVLIGAQDRSVKRGNSFTSEPKLAKLIQAQINVTKATKIAFWNLFEAMGGVNSMSEWVNANPPLAHKDYIHFNEYGVKKVAEMFSDALLDVK